MHNAAVSIVSFEEHDGTNQNHVIAQSSQSEESFEFLIQLVIAVILELLNCLPLLWEYHLYKNIASDQLVIRLTLFFAFRFLFFFFYFDRETYVFHYLLTENCCFIFLSLCFPLIPSICLVYYTPDVSKRNYNSALFSLYLLLTYGSMSTLFAENPGIITKSSLYVMYMLIVLSWSILLFSRRQKANTYILTKSNLRKQPGPTRYGLFNPKYSIQQRYGTPTSTKWNVNSIVSSESFPTAFASGSPQPVAQHTTV